jgi:hypothetical protein
MSFVVGTGYGLYVQARHGEEPFSTTSARKQRVVLTML